MKKNTDAENLSVKINAFKKKHGNGLSAQEPQSPQSGAAKGFQFCIEFISGVLVALAIGFFLDKVFSSFPICLAVCAVFGSAAGVLNVYRYAKTSEKENA